MLAGFFGLREKGTTIRTEVIAGVTTFLTMGYIIFVNPEVLSATGMDRDALVVVTCVVCAAATISVGLIAGAPIAMAPGMGLNAFFAYLVSSAQMTWQEALGVVFLSGLLFLILTAVGLRRKIVEAIPSSLIAAIAVGIGLFITFIGLVKLGIIVDDPNTLVTAGELGPTVLVGLFGLAVIVFLEMRKVRGALVLGIVAATLLAAATGETSLPEKLVSMKLDVRPVALQLDIAGALRWSFFGTIFTLVFMDMFDSVGTLIACSYQAGIVDERGNIKGLDRLLAIDACATTLGAVCGTSTTTSYIESAAGIEQGGRSGLTSVVTGALFLVAIPFVPVVSAVPQYATAPALIMVGLFMMGEVKKIDFSSVEEGFPAFIIMVMIALSYSISTGLAFGFVSFVLIKVVAGKIREIRATMWIIAGLSIVFLGMDWVRPAIEAIWALVRS